MTELLTESFCERCGTKYTFEGGAEAPSPVRRARMLVRGLRNYLLSDDPLDEAFAEARRDDERDSAGRQLDAFHKTFNFCIECRQYVCTDCWNEGASRCLTCAPMAGRMDALRLEVDLPGMRATAPGRPATARADASTVPAVPAQVGDLAWPATDLVASSSAGRAPALPAPAAAPGTVTSPEQPGPAGPIPSMPPAPLAAAAVEPTAGELSTVEPTAAIEPVAVEPTVVEPLAAAAEPAPEAPAVPPVTTPPPGAVQPPEAGAPARPPAPAWQIVAPDDAAAGRPPAQPAPTPAGWPPRAPVYQPPAPRAASPSTRPAQRPAGQPASPPAWVPPTRRPAAPSADAPATPPAWLPPAAPAAPGTAAAALWEESARSVLDRPGSGVQACVSCGLPLSATARFCRRCGARQG